MHTVHFYCLIFVPTNAHTYIYTGCPTTYQTLHFFNNSKTNEDIATRFEQEYVRCMGNEEECVGSVCRFRCNIFIGFSIMKEIPGLVRSGTLYILNYITNAPICFAASAPSSWKFDIAFSKVIK
jgi:hypothetical protein